MPGLVGYAGNAASKGDKPLAAMVSSMGNKLVVNSFSGRSLHIARLHLGIFNVEKQPVWNEDGTLGIMTYGKIYGYEREVEKLKGLGHRFSHTSNDAEYILHAYEEFGNDAFSKLNGSYAFVIFNDKEGDLVVVNDRYGTRPIYYALEDRKLVFASTARAILEHPYPKILNERTIVKFFRYGQLGILGNDTWFKGIQLMPSASFLEFHRGKTRIEKYWDLNYLADYDEKEENFVRELLEKFRKAVNMRIGDKAKLGISLSGGLDSRSVCAAISEEKLSKINAYTFGVENCNEFRVAKMVANKLGLKSHTLIKLNPSDLVRYAENVVYLTDGLDTIAVGFIPFAYEKIREMGIEVFLQGFILDATLGGSFLTAKMAQAQNITDLTLALDKRYTLFSSSEMRKLLGKRLGHIIDNVQREFAEAVRNAKGDNLLNKADYFTINTRFRRYTILGSIIAREFVEESLPTIDNEVIDVISKIPPEYRLDHHIYKKFLSDLNKESARIPYVKTMVRANASDFLWRLGRLYLKFIRLTKRVLWKLSRRRIYLPNKHYYIDLGEVWRTNHAWKKFLVETLLNHNSLCYKLGYLREGFVRKVVKEHYSGVKNNSEKIAFLITLEVLLRTYWGEDETRKEKN
ncbi:MAG: asparagine synthase-related protein [Candidatus Bathyarchaeota archaeon]|jgi:asparagine synthase (glutamine-hydrolysing)